MNVRGAVSVLVFSKCLSLRAADAAGGAQQTEACLRPGTIACLVLLSWGLGG